MKLCVSTWSFHQWRQQHHKPFEPALKIIADLGAGAAEFAGLDEKAGKRTLKRAATLRETCRTLGLAVASYCISANFLLEGEEQREMVRKTKEHVDIAAELGVKTMRHDVTWGPPKGRKMTFGQVLKIVAPGVREVTEYAKGKGIKTSVENHGFYLQTAERVERLVKAVGSGNFGVTLDMGNFLCLDQDPVAAAKRLARYAVMVHAKDFHTRPVDRMPPSGWFATPTKIALRGAIAGHGVVDIPAILRILKKARYDGYLSVEFEGMEDAVQGVKLSLEYLRRELAAL